MTYEKLKQGDAFSFIQNGAIYIRCRGGYRPGCGGVLTKFNFSKIPVFIYESFRG
jgi:hypothetical protein